ncbi:flagellin FliC, partial [Shigella sonnei]
QDTQGNPVPNSFAAKTSDGTYIAVNVDAATGNTSVITDPNGKAVEWAVKNDGSAQAIMREDDKVYTANI